jgi:hypothetical protein
MFYAWIPSMVNVVFELLLRRDIGHFETLTARRVFPPVIGAAETILFDPAEK